MVEARTEPSPIGIQKYLGGVDYPADKQQLIDIARRHQAPDDVIKTLEELPGDKFEGPDRVMKAYGQIKH